MSAELEVAVEAALAGGAALTGLAGKVREVSHKGRIDLVTEADRISQAAILKVLRRAFPSYAVLAEELPEKPRPGAVRWLVDPLDGTTNFVHSYPVYAISVALEREGELALGVVYDPTREELFTAEVGGGAFLNGAPIHVSRTEHLLESLLATGFPYDIAESAENNLDLWELFALRAQALRRDGSAALDLCYLAMGRFDGFWEIKLGPWDLAAGSLIAREAGGVATGLAGEPLDIYSGSIVASNGLIHQEMLEVTRSQRSPR